MGTTQPITNSEAQTRKSYRCRHLPVNARPPLPALKLIIREDPVSACTVMIANALPRLTHVVRASPWRPSTASGVSWLFTRTPGLPAPRVRILPPRTHAMKPLEAATRAGLGDALTPEYRPQGRFSDKGGCPGKGGPWPVSPGSQPFLWLDTQLVQCCESVRTCTRRPCLNSSCPVV